MTTTIRLAASNSTRFTDEQYLYLIDDFQTSYLEKTKLTYEQLKRFVDDKAEVEKRYDEEGAKLHKIKSDIWKLENSWHDEVAAIEKFEDYFLDMDNRFNWRRGVIEARLSQYQTELLSFVETELMNEFEPKEWIDEYVKPFNYLRDNYLGPKAIECTVFHKLSELDMQLEKQQPIFDDAEEAYENWENMTYEEIEEYLRF